VKVRSPIVREDDLNTVTQNLRVSPLMLTGVRTTYHDQSYLTVIQDKFRSDSVAV
jgi:hypothetical protein